MSLAGAVLFTYAITWSFSGLYLFVRGKSTAIWLWPLFPFIWIRIIVGRGVGRLSNEISGRGLPSLMRRVGGYCLLAVPIGGFIFAAARWSIVSLAWGAFTGIIFLSFAAFFIIRGIKTLVYRHKDHKVLRRQLSGSDTLSVNALLSLLANIRTDEGLRTLTTALRRGQYSCLYEVVEFLSDLSAYVELIHKSFGSAPSGTSVSPQIQSWLQKREITAKSLSPANISNETLDEIARLIETQSKSTE